jgi:hypothetical protein
MAALLARRERDGLSLQRLSRETGIPVGTLSWWNWRLRQTPEPSPSSSCPFPQGPHDIEPIIPTCTRTPWRHPPPTCPLHRASGANAIPTLQPTSESD